MDSRVAPLDRVGQRFGGNVDRVTNVVAAVAIVLWLGATALETGMSILPAGVATLAFLVPLTVASLVSRSVGFRLQLSFLLWGAFVVAVGLLAIDGFQLVDPRLDTLRDYVVPFLEETLKLLPLLVYLFLRRRDRTWTLGATDVLLLAATTGAAFGFVEDAYIRHAHHWSEGLPWLPVTSLLDFKHRLVAGHAIWTAIAGGALGLAFLWRHRLVLAVPLGMAGFLWAWLDHTATNQLASGGRDGSSSAVVAVWRVIEGNGFFSVYLLLALLAVAVVADRWALRSTEPLVIPALPTPTGLLDRWRWIRARRALTFGAWHLRGYVADHAPAPLVQLRMLLSGAAIGSLALVFLAVTGFAAAGALVVIRLLPPGPGLVGWLHDVGVNIGNQGIPGGVAIGVGAGALSVGGPPGPPPPPDKGGPPLQTVSRFPPAQHPPVPPTVWERAINWVNDVSTAPKDAAKVSIGRRLEIEALHAEEEVRKPPHEEKTHP